MFLSDAPAGAAHSVRGDDAALTGGTGLPPSLPPGQQCTGLGGNPMHGVATSLIETKDGKTPALGDGVRRTGW